MIARVKFEATATDLTSNKTDVIQDYVDIHVVNKEDAKEIFNNWSSHTGGIRGHSDVFHPIGLGGNIKVKNVTIVEDKKKGKK